MSKNVLIISSSARKGGNSDTLCDRFAAGASDAGHAVEKVRLAEKNIGCCRGCYACSKSGVCVQGDDMGELLEKMEAADVIVLASPVYFYTVSGRLKNFIDRTLPHYPFKDWAGKHWYFILAAAENDREAMKHAVGDFLGYMENMTDPVIKETIYGVGAWNVGDVQALPVMEEAYQAGLHC